MTELLRSKPLRFLSFDSRMLPKKCAQRMPNRFPPYMCRKDLRSLLNHFIAFKALQSSQPKLPAFVITSFLGVRIGP